MAARKKRRKKKAHINFKSILIFLLFFALVVLSIVTYLIQSGYANKWHDKFFSPTKEQKQIIEQTQKKLELKKESIINDIKIKQKKLKENEFFTHPYKSINDAINEFKNDKNTTNKNIKKDFHDKNTSFSKKDPKKIDKPKRPEPSVFTHQKPKLTIIIDDVSFEYQLKKIQAIGYKITPSFLPPTPNHPNSSKIAKNVSFYMVHLPLEAKYYKKQERRTLKKGENYEDILAWIKECKKAFPKAKFYNNHTGSKFTSDEKSMNNLLKAIYSEGLIFVDSKTSKDSKASMIAKKHGKKLLSRDIFLDNSKDKKYIKSQLQKAINIAHKKGFAIAIGHPYDETLEVLKQEKNNLKNLDLVYIDELY